MELPFIDTTLIYLTNDQPTCCKVCGTRTNWLADFSHTKTKQIIHECQDTKCGYMFYEEDDTFIEL